MTLAYAANNGSEGFNGTSELTPKLLYASAVALLAAPSDKVYARRGDGFRETGTAPVSGTTGAGNIVFGAYGSGANPIINGADLITGAWTALGGGELTIQIAANNDNYKINETGATYDNSILLAGNDNTQDINMALRWQLNVPQGATITEAHIRGYQTDGYGGSVLNQIYGHDADNSAQVTTYAGWATAHGTLTTANVAWDNAGGLSAATWYDSPDIKTIIQEITDRGGWASGNYVHLFVDNDGSAAFNYRRLSRLAAGNPVELIVDYSTALDNLYTHALTTAPDMLIVDDVLGTKKASQAACVADGDWFWAANVLSLYSATNPDNRVIEWPNRSYCITTNAKNYITIQDLTLKGTKEWGAGAKCVQSSFVTVQRCLLTLHYYSGFTGSGDSHGNMTVRECEVSYCGRPGITSWYNTPDVDTGNNLFTLNHVHNCVWRDEEDSAIIGTANNNEISYNLVHDNALAVNVPSHLTFCHGIYFGQPATTGQLVHHNIIRRQGAGNGIKLQGSGRAYWNVSEFNYQAGITVGFNVIATATVTLDHNVCRGNYQGIWAGMYTSGTFTLNAYHNVLVDNLNTELDVYTAEFSVPYDVPFLNFKNNLLSGMAAYHNELSMVTQTNAVFDYNAYQYGSKWYNNNLIDWTTWQGLGFDLNSLNQVNPQFVDPVNGNFHLLSTSPLGNRGLIIPGINDGTGGSEAFTGSAPDIGAYENPFAYVSGARLKEITTSTGTGPKTLDGVDPADLSFRPFSVICQDGNMIEVTIKHRTAAEWETALCMWTMGGVLTRIQLRESSNGNAPVDFSAGTKDAWCDFPAAYGLMPVVNRFQTQDVLIPPGTSVYIAGGSHIAPGVTNRLGVNAVEEVG